MTTKWKQDAIAYLFLLPWLLGLFIFTLGPMLSSVYLSFTNFDLFTAPRWIGIDNYRAIFTADNRFLKALGVTFTFVLVSVPLKLLFALSVAMLLNRSLRGIGLYRSVYYLPSLVGQSIAVAIMWRQLFGHNGLINQWLALFDIQGKVWISHPTYAIYTICLLAVWQFGSSMVIFLAGLKQIPEYLYESSAIDGATKFRQFWLITLPMLTPVLFFNLVIQTIGGFMVFTQGYIITKGGPMDSTLFYALYLYEKGFSYFQMGYASALANLLLVLIGVVTALLFKSSAYWVHYEAKEGRG